MIKKITGIIIVILFLCVSIQPSFASVLISGDGTWGDFTGSLTYNANSTTSARLSVALMNTSPIANGGFLTGFVFNNPANLITGITGTSFTNTKFQLLGLSDNGISASPYGGFDMGAALGGNFLGGGNPNFGISVNDTAEFIFYLAGNSLNTLNESSFINELSDGSNEFFLARFRGFNNGQSNKTPTDVVPEPATMSLLGMGLLGLLGFRKKK